MPGFELIGNPSKPPDKDMSSSPRGQNNFLNNCRVNITKNDHTDSMQKRKICWRGWEIDYKPSKLIQ